MLVKLHSTCDGLFFMHRHQALVTPPLSLLDVGAWRAARPTCTTPACPEKTEGVKEETNASSDSMHAHLFAYTR